MIKYYITILATLCVNTLHAATCTTTTRTNYTSGQVLTSTALNADLNQLVSKVNGLDGGCVTDGSLEAAALNSTDFATVTHGIKEGCTVGYVDTNTVSVGKCILSVNGNFVKTTTSTNATWGCSGCSAEATEQQYYIYAKSTSSGTTLTPVISTTAPGADGYDVSLNRVLGKFWNNTSGNINPKVDTYINGSYFTEDRSITAPSSKGVESIIIINEGCPLVPGACGFSDFLLNPTAVATTNVSSVTRISTGNVEIKFARSYEDIVCFTSNFTPTNRSPFSQNGVATDNVNIFTLNSSSVFVDDTFASLCYGVPLE